jgi:hypothetical protein
VLYVQRHDAGPHRAAILKAVTRDLRYDRQFEHLRSQYAVDLMRASGEPAYYRDALLAALANPGEDQSEDLMVEIACLLAEDGDVAARQAVYDAFERHWGDDTWTGVEEMTRLDGADGLLRALRRLTAVDWKAEAWYLSMLITDTLEAQMGKREAWRALEAAARNDERVGQALKHVRELGQERAAAKTKPYVPQPPMPYDALIPLLDGDGMQHMSALRRWGRSATEEDLMRAANALLAETDPTRTLAYLRVFTVRPFPLDPAPLIALTDSENWDTAHAANLALEKVCHPAVRAYALRAVRDPKRASHAVDMLSLNFQEGDHALIEWLAEQPEVDEDEEHSRGLGMTHFVKQHE